MTAKPPAPSPPPKPAPKLAERQAREAKALRANLRKRKGQQAARTERVAKALDRASE